MIIAFVSLKGGVGKTTSMILTANNLAARGNRVLVVDSDPNNSTTMYYLSGVENSANICQVKNIFEALTHRDASNYITPTRKSNIDIIPSSLYLSDIRTIDTKVLKTTLKKIENNYDYILIDTAPTYDNHTIAALYAADLIFTPIEFTSFNETTTAFLQSKLYEELPEQVNKWYVLYAHWQDRLSEFASSLQSQFANKFEHDYDNILTIKIPETKYVDKYTQADEKVSLNSRIIGAKRLAESYNALVNMITGKENNIEVF